MLLKVAKLSRATGMLSNVKPLSLSSKACLGPVRRVATGVKQRQAVARAPRQACRAGIILTTPEEHTAEVFKQCIVLFTSLALYTHVQASNLQLFGGILAASSIPSALFHVYSRSNY